MLYQERIVTKKSDFVLSLFYTIERDEKIVTQMTGAVGFLSNWADRMELRGRNRKVLVSK
jgi:hypothetical protein